MLSNLVRLAGGREAAHAFSAPYPGYSAAETDAKLDHALAASGPHSCRYIQETLGFRGCPPDGHGVKSPAGLAWTRPATDAPILTPYLEPIGVFLAEPDDEVTWIFPELLPVGVVMLLHGEPRAKKSLGAFELALSAATGTAPFGLARFQPAVPIPVIYVQEEDGRPLTRQRLRALVADRCATPPPDLTVAIRRGVDLDDPAWVDRLIADCQGLRVQFLVLDAARRLSRLTDEGPQKVRELTGILRRIVTECALSIAIVHHDVKPPITGPDGRRRSQRASGGDWFAACECPVQIERISSVESLVFPEDYKFTADPLPFHFTTIIQDRLVIRLVGRDTDVASAEKAGVRGKLLAWLTGNGPATLAAMRKAGFRYDDIKPLLDSLGREGKVDAVPGKRANSLSYFIATAPSSP
jgi:hypothetical protein